MPARILCAVFVLAGCAFAVGPAAAEESRVLSDRWYVTIGGSLLELATDASFGSGTVVGTEINVEDDLGLPTRSSTIRLLVEYRFGKRHALGLDFLKINRSGGVTLEKSIEFEGKTYDVGATVSGTFDSTMFPLTYHYSFTNDGVTEAGILAGLSVWQVSAGVAGQASISDGNGGTVTAFARAGRRLLLPIPTFGIFVRHRLGSRAVFLASAGYFRGALGDIEGRVLDTKLDVATFFSKHVGIGFGLEGTEMHYDDDGEKPVHVEYRQNSIVAYLTLAF